MKTKNIQRINITWVVVGTIIILMIPLIAMQFSEEVNWQPFDFLVFGTLLMGTGFAFEVLKAKMKSPTHRTALAIVLLGLLILTWAELAVGIFGTPFAGS